jgi:DNA-binding MarR family transcriptional regulator
MAEATSRSLASLINKLHVLDDRPHGLLSTRMRALRAIQAGGRRGVTQAELARELKLSATLICRLSDELERADLIRREAHPLDRRKNALVLTERGRSQVGVCGQALTATTAATAQALPEAEMAQLEMLLTKLAAKLTSSGCQMICEACLLGGCDVGVG